MIPKIIHYCWFGNNEKPDIIKKCISSWHKHCPDYKIVEWNELNWDIHKHPYPEKAYAAGKWAFVSDYARLDILCQHGGIYLDTDVEIKSKPCEWEEYLQYREVLVFENARGINTGLFFASEKETLLVKKLMACYNEFSNDSMVVNTKMNKPVFSELYPELQWNGQNQTYGNTLILGTADYDKIMYHYGTRTWAEDLPKYHISGSMRLKHIMRNPEIFRRLEEGKLTKRVLPIYQFMAYDLLDLGPVYFFKLNAKKLKREVKSMIHKRP